MGWYSIVRRGASPAVAGVLWEPSKLSSLVAWYDADSITGLSNGATVSGWTDRAGNFDLSAVGTPTFNTTGINSKPVVQFDGASMTAGVAADFKFLHTAAYSVAGLFQVGYSGATQSGNGYPITTTTSTGQIGCEYRFNASNNRFICSHLVGSNVKSAQVTDATVSQTQPVLFAAVGDAASSTASQRMELFTDGTSVGTNSITNTPSTSDPANPLIVGSITGYVAELVVCNAEVTSGDRQKLEGYLAHKWGLTANLPANHPYKSSPPVWAQATGGTETTVGGYKYHTFTSDGTLTVSSGGTLEYLIVGGGGGGASTVLGGGGGGGAGGLLSGTAAVTPQSYTITVGAGGAGTPASTQNTDGVSGGDSAAFGLTATGGGGGGYFRGGGLGGGLTGGSGGGAGANRDGTRAGGTGTSGQGNDGATGLVTSGVASQSGGGGGGGAGSVGSSSTTSGGGAGGAGAEWPTGSGTYYAAGGQAGHGNNSTTTANGAANTGNGGTGSQYPTAAGSGGSGIVIVRYPI